MSNIEIEKNVPMPVTAKRRSYKLPFDKMAAGDSIFVAYESQIEAERIKVRRSVMGMAHGAGKKLGIKFVARSFDDGVRVWRTGEPVAYTGLEAQAPAVQHSHAHEYAAAAA